MVKTEYNQIKINYDDEDYNQINEYENDSNINDDSDLGNDEIWTIKQIENEYNDDVNNNKRNENDNCWNTDEIKIKEMKLEEFVEEKIVTTVHNYFIYIII